MLKMKSLALCMDGHIPVAAQTTNRGLLLEAAFRTSRVVSLIHLDLVTLWQRFLKAMPMPNTGQMPRGTTAKEIMQCFSLRMVSTILAFKLEVITLPLENAMDTF